jgi:molybdate transport system substrate-binding protein
MFRRHAALAMLALVALTPARPAAAQDWRLIVFAAASLKDALDRVNAGFPDRDRRPVTVSYAASSTLMRQIEQGAPAQVFISADTDWMAYAAERKLIDPASRVDLLGNSLVLIAAVNSPLAPVTIAPGFDLARLAGDGRIATGDVRSVPAGKYAKAALESLGAWDAVAPKLAMAENVRVALALVARREAVLGVVYATDAAAEPGVKVIGRFPPGSHPPIVYPAAVTAGAGESARAYLAFLQGSLAHTGFERSGFTALTPRAD